MPTGANWSLSPHLFPVLRDGHLSIGISILAYWLDISCFVNSFHDIFDLMLLVVWWALIHQETESRTHGKDTNTVVTTRRLMLVAALRIRRARVKGKRRRWLPPQCGPAYLGTFAADRKCAVTSRTRGTSTAARTVSSLFITLMLGQSAMHACSGPTREFDLGSNYRSGTAFRAECYHYRAMGGSLDATGCGQTRDGAVDLSYCMYIPSMSGQLHKDNTLSGSLRHGMALKGTRIGEATNPGPNVTDFDQAECVVDFLDEADLGEYTAFVQPPELELLAGDAAINGDQDEEQLGPTFDHRLDEVDQLIDMASEWAPAKELTDSVELACQAFHRIHGCTAGPDLTLPGDTDSSTHGSVRGVVHMSIVDPHLEAKNKEAAAKAQKFLAASRAYAARVAAARLCNSKRNSPSQGAVSRAVQVPLKQDLIPTVPMIEEDLPQFTHDVVSPPPPPSGGHGANQVGGSPNPRRPRGRRQRGRQAGTDRDTIDIWTFNSSGSPQLRAALNFARHHAERKPAVLLSQEHHTTSAKVPDLQEHAKRLGWRIAPAHATTTSEGGVSAGVAICTPSHVAAGVDHRGSVDGSPKDSPGRFASQWVQELVPCGFMAGSCYLYTREGGTARNVALLSRALCKLKSSNCPWVMGLDAQQQPADFLRWAAPAIERAGARIIYPDEPTHFPGAGEEKCIDFFIVDNSLVGAVHRVSVTSELVCTGRDGTHHTVAAKPHRLVKMSLRSSAVPRLQTRLKMPRLFEKVKPCGCARQPHAPQDDHAQGIAKAATREEKMEAASDAWVPLVKCIEAESSVVGEGRQTPW